jgi:hypothetical protein
MNPEEEEYDQDAFDAYCDRLCDEHRDSELFGD